MNRRLYSLMVLLAFTAGLAGGLLATHFSATAPALAANTSDPQKIISAEPKHRRQAIARFWTLFNCQNS